MTTTAACGEKPEPEIVTGGAPVVCRKQVDEIPGESDMVAADAVPENSKPHTAPTAR